MVGPMAGPDHAPFAEACTGRHPNPQAGRAVAQAVCATGSGPCAVGPCAGVRGFCADGSHADPGRACGHEPRPTDTIRQRSRPTAVVRLMVGPDHGSPAESCAQGVRPDCAASDGCCSLELRNRPAVVRSRTALTGCATGRVLPRLVVCKLGCRTAQTLPRPLAATGCALVEECRGRAAQRSPLRPSAQRAEAAGTRRWPARGWPVARGRADHGPDHGLCVPIVTVVGGPWSVVGSGPAGFLKVRSIRSDLGV